MQVTVETQHRRVCSSVAKGFGIKRMRDKVRLTAKVLSGRKHLQPKTPQISSHSHQLRIDDHSPWQCNSLENCNLHTGRAHVSLPNITRPRLNSVQLPSGCISTFRERSLIKMIQTAVLKGHEKDLAWNGNRRDYYMLPKECAAESVHRLTTELYNVWTSCGVYQCDRGTSP